MTENNYRVTKGGMMKYALKNLRSFMEEERLVFVLTCLSIFCSALILNISYGIYNEINRAALDDAYGINELLITFEADSSKEATKEELLEVFDAIDSNILENMGAAIDGHFPQDEPDMESMFTFNVRFSMGRMTSSRQVYGNLRTYGLWEKGEYFTDEQYENGELVAIIGDSEDVEDIKYKAKNGNVEIDGQTYRVIGQQRATVTPWIPFTSVRDDFVIDEFCFTTESPMTKKQYMNIADAVRAVFEDRADLPGYPVPDADTTMLYQSIMVICILIAIISALVYMVLYQYIVDKRKRTLDIFRISGLSIRSAQGIYMKECIVLLTVCYGSALAVFHFLILPRMQSIYDYMDTIFTPSVYVRLGLLYFSVLYIIVRGKITLSLHKMRMVERG